MSCRENTAGRRNSCAAAGINEGEMFMSDVKLLTGNEAVARGAYEAGVLFASAYP